MALILVCKSIDVLSANCFKCNCIDRGSYFTTYRMGDWKLIYYYLPETPKQPKALLYNLKDDPEERNELSSAHPDKCREMIQEMSAQLEKEGALYPVDKQGNELKPFVYF